MNYNVRWIQKYLGISRKTLSVYEEKGFIIPLEKPDDEYRTHKLMKKGCFQMWFGMLNTIVLKPIKTYAALERARASL